jgi:hypothetical protein
MSDITDDMSTSIAYDPEHHESWCKRGWRGGECCGATSSYEFGGACDNCPERQDCTCDVAINGDSDESDDTEVEAFLSVYQRTEHVDWCRDLYCGGCREVEE